MTIGEWCVPGAFFLAILTIGIGKLTGRAQFDNNAPRNPAFWRDPFRARALAAHQNGLEALPLFAFAVLLAEFRNVPQSRLDLLALAFLVLRAVYVALYLKGFGAARSMVWSAGLAVNLAILALPLWSH